MLKALEPLLAGTSFIGGAPATARGESFRAVNPQTNQPLDPPFFEASGVEIDQAMKLAASAFLLYRRIEASRRAAFLSAIASEIENLGEALIDRAAAETALTPPRLISERGRTVSQLRMFARLIESGSWVEARIDTADPARKPAPKPDVRRMLTPLGPVVVFGASNFPLAFSVAGGDTASALAAGCAVVVKGHPSHPGTSELVASAVLQAARRTEMPDGVFSLLQGRSNDLGAALVKHPATQAVGFTGSLRAGRALMDLAAARPAPIPVFAEMGSANPVFLLPGAIAERANRIAGGLRDSVTLGVGQFCTKPGIVVLQKSEHADGFVELLVERLSATPPGAMLNEGIRNSYVAGRRALVEIPGVTRLGSETVETAKWVTAAAFATDAQTFLSQPRLSDEVFGPAVLIVTVSSTDQMLEIARHLEGHLTATIHCADDETEMLVRLTSVLECKVGRIIVNGYPTGVEVCHAMEHGGPYPASSDARSTSVGTAAISRFARPVCYQDFPAVALPVELQDSNPQDIWRMVDGRFGRGPIRNKLSPL